MSDPITKRAGNSSISAGHCLSSTPPGAISCSKITHERSTVRFGILRQHAAQYFGVVRNDDAAADAGVRPDDASFRVALQTAASISLRKLGFSSQAGPMLLCTSTGRLCFSARSSNRLEGF